jgi:hypothetical protein
MGMRGMPATISITADAGSARSAVMEQGSGLDAKWAKRPGTIYSTRKRITEANAALGPSIFLGSGL